MSLSEPELEALYRRIRTLETQVERLDKLEAANANTSRILSTFILMHGARRMFLWNRHPEAAATTLVDVFSTAASLSAGSPGRATEGLMTYGEFDGVDDFWWDGASTTANHYYGSMAMVAWVKFDSDCLGSSASIASRWRTATANRSYWLRKNASDALQFSVSGNGTAEASVTSSLTVVADQWYFVAARHTASSELALWVSNPTTKKLVKDTNTTSIPANSFPTGAAEWNVGARNNGAGTHTDYLAGQLALLWTGAYATPEAQITNAWLESRKLLGY